MAINTYNTFLRVNTFHLNMLSPLLKWKILSLKNLQQISNYQGKVNTFRKILLRLEKNGIIKSFIEPMSKSKYIFLTSLGAKLSGFSNYQEISKEILFHDSKMVEIAQEFLKLNCIEEVMLEHEISKISSLIPDAIFKGQRNNIDFKLAVELEITQKSKVRIEEKIREYLISIDYDYVLYIFCVESIFNNYKKTLNERIGNHVWKKVIFLYIPSILDGPIQILNVRGFFDNNEIGLKDVF